MKPDGGLLVLEDLADPDRKQDRGGPLHILDKVEILPLAAAKSIMVSVAHFHGIWLQWMKHQDPPSIGKT